ncbi:hypothetical protein H4582DRAFT_2067926 [Lactarius indigo]|nr:hypothetical protein H4582DRAFT_2067926 [Lactarius indigo]
MSRAPPKNVNITEAGSFRASKEEQLDKDYHKLTQILSPALHLERHSLSHPRRSPWPCPTRPSSTPTALCTPPGVLNVHNRYEDTFEDDARAAGLLRMSASLYPLTASFPKRGS